MGITLAWRRSSHCESNQCVDVAVTAAGVLVRGNAGGPVLRFPPEAWRALCAALKASGGDGDRFVGVARRRPDPAGHLALGPEGHERDRARQHDQ
ncbi:DUF397 domain-containing protein [Asanoa siamensis]|nr:DUF397 domain-containing protein [Asanoa siamensis]